MISTIGEIKIGTDAPSASGEDASLSASQMDRSISTVPTLPWSAGKASTSKSSFRPERGGGKKENAEK